LSQKTRKFILCLVHLAKLCTKQEESWYAVFRLRRWWWSREECNHCTFTRNTKTLKVLNTKLISKSSVNSMDISDKKKNKSIIKLPGGSTENKYFQCKISMNKEW
jgi:hypothetical protein